jgi:hypothetical protein
MAKMPGKQRSELLWKQEGERVGNFWSNFRAKMKAYWTALGGKIRFSQQDSRTATTAYTTFTSRSQ